MRTLLVLAALARVAAADPELDKLASQSGDDQALYSCKKRTGDVAITFKPETELKELVTWVMGFTCKNFLFDPRVVSTARKVGLVAPAPMTQAEAYRLFLVALATMG